MTTQKIRTIYTISLVFLDATLIAAAFAFAYQLRIRIDWPSELMNQAPFIDYIGLMMVQIAAILSTFSFYRLYYIPRSASRVDRLYSVIAGATVGTMMAVAISVFIFKNDDVILDYPRTMTLYAWLLSIIFITVGRMGHQMMREWLRDHNIGRDRLLIVGTGEMAEIILQRVMWTPHLGYTLVGMVSDDEYITRDVAGVAVLGDIDALPTLIADKNIDEVIIAMPEKGHRETMRVVSYCGERGNVSIKIFPDVFELVTSEATIDALGGLPLLSVRDYALRGYMRLFKRIIDMLGSGFGLIALSPMMLLTAVAIKLESPGPVFFVQERMGLDGKRFWMLKFRSMRKDAEKDGPGWTVDNDPRRTKLGSFMRKVEMDELPNLINVFLGEMSLVGPRPEQAHYVQQFRQTVPRYMERHREKGGMTGWAQINGLRGDTSIAERTKYDLWYSEHWSILLDVKIIIRTVWQIFDRKNENRAQEGEPDPDIMSDSFA